MKKQTARQQERAKERKEQKALRKQGNNSTNSLVGGLQGNMPEENKDPFNVNGENLWNNPMVKNAMKAMTPEQLESYRIMGENLYGDMNFDNLEYHVDNTAAYLMSLLKSGIHPSYLDENDKEILNQKIGKEWYKQFGFTENDLKQIN